MKSARANIALSVGTSGSLNPESRQKGFVALQRLFNYFTPRIGKDSIVLELICGPDAQRAVVAFTFDSRPDDFLSCVLRIELFPQLDLRLSCLLFHKRDYLKLRDAIVSSAVGLDSPIRDSDFLLTVWAETRADWVEWSFEWEGVYPAFPPFNADASMNARLQIRGLRQR